MAFERQWWKYAGAKEEAIKELFSMSATRYYQVLNALIDRPEALAADPMLVKRLRRLRASRQKAALRAGSASRSPDASSVFAAFRALLATVGSMSERVPDSSGLPLRAMVMVLLFLGVIFLLVGFQAMSSAGKSDDDDSTTVPTVTTSTPAPRTSAKGAAALRSDVRVYNISGQDGVAARTADQLRAPASTSPRSATSRCPTSRPPRSISATQRVSVTPPTRSVSSCMQRWSREYQRSPTSRRASLWWSPASRVGRGEAIGSRYGQARKEPHSRCRNCIGGDRYPGRIAGSMHPKPTPATTPGTTPSVWTGSPAPPKTPPEGDRCRRRASLPICGRPTGPRWRLRSSSSTPAT
ncbi:hypothetical protein I553_1936 [Mycobacterium xenopi 4042]|uniref:DUF3263 domain-containing protein n=1 Tax=Mycobacterium xenopi 4042 TaxID=1299334 RepID=X8DM31_MYCXE|nr:hypothetical protein I553_1936 [Mycobacterium xenopi 4042]